jgi:hypothetical protein
MPGFHPLWHSLASSAWLALLSTALTRLAVPAVPQR